MVSSIVIRNRVPVLAIASHIPQSEVGLNYFQETHPENLFKECSCFCELVSNPKQMPEILFRAMNAAIGNQDVAVIVLPGDVGSYGNGNRRSYLYGTNLVYLISFHNTMTSKKWLLI